MELMKFYDIASPAEKKLLDRLMNGKKWKTAWGLVQKVTKTKLVGKEFHEQVLKETPERDPLEIQLRREEIRTLRLIARQIARVARNME